MKGYNTTTRGHHPFFNSTPQIACGNPALYSPGEFSFFSFFLSAEGSFLLSSFPSALIGSLSHSSCLKFFIRYPLRKIFSLPQWFLFFMFFVFSKGVIGGSVSPHSLDS